MSSLAPRFSEAIKQIDAGTLSVPGVIGAADALIASGEIELSLTLYKYWLLANPENPLRYAVAFNCGSQLLTRKDIQGAQAFLAQAVAANPDFAPARLNLASAYEHAGEPHSALALWQETVNRLAAVSPSNISSKTLALKNIARVQKGTETAEQALHQAIEIDSTQVELIQHWVNNRQSRCIWPTITPIGALTVEDIEATLAPLSMCIYSADAKMQLETARRESQRFVRDITRTTGKWPNPANPTPDKIRIGYLSSDFCGHAVGYLISDVFGLHNRDRFEITVFNISPRTNDPIQQKIMTNVDRWIDLYGITDKEAAKTILNHGIHILLDMNGHTNYQRTKLLAMKPAPIIVNWLGYPGTMGSEDHDYIIADDFIIPTSHEHFYSERVVRLPCYQPNGPLYPVKEPSRTKAELGLPEDAIVYCCFNGAVKITEPVFATWMNILRQVPNSVLWIRGSGAELSIRGSLADAETQLRKEAVARGVAAERLVVLPFQSNTEYLACHRYADIFLDTFPYGAHTTASDALRMGVPIITLIGDSFASRVAGSLSRAAGLPGLAFTRLSDYANKAIELGNDRQQLDKLKQQLSSALPTCDLLNTPLLVKSLEALFEDMWSAHCNPTH